MSITLYQHTRHTHKNTLHKTILYNTSFQMNHFQNWCQKLSDEKIMRNLQKPEEE